MFILVSEGVIEISLNFLKLSKLVKVEHSLETEIAKKSGNKVAINLLKPLLENEQFSTLATNI